MDPSKTKQKCTETSLTRNDGGGEDDVHEMDALRQELREKEMQLKEKSQLVSKLEAEASNRESYVVQLETQATEEQALVTKLSNELQEVRGARHDVQPSLSNSDVSNEDALPSNQDKTTSSCLQCEEKDRIILKMEAQIAQLGRERDTARRERQGSGEMIPPEVWAQVLEFSTYEDVARMARVSTSFLHQVMPLVRTLYIKSEEAITPSQAQRFQNGQLEEIIIDCLFGYLGIRVNVGDGVAFRIQDWAGEAKLASFLGLLPSIKTVFLGKGVGETKSQILGRLGLQEAIHEGTCSYHVIDNFAEAQAQSFRDGVSGYRARSHGDLFPTNHETYSGMIRSLCQGYRTGTIPQTMHIYGLPAVHDHWDDQGCVFGYCNLCDEMCATFPLDQVLSLKTTCVKCYFPNKLGNSLQGKLQALLQYPGGRKAIASKKDELFRDLLQQIEIQILDFAEEDAIAIGYEHEVMMTLKTLKLYGYNAESGFDANAHLTNACKRALKGVSVCRDYSGRFRYTEPILIMEKDYLAFVNDIGFNLVKDNFRLVSETSRLDGNVATLGINAVRIV